ncbi:uncharacterized protein C2orf42 [Phlebotomus argentipes]|uniref:uncharacterized protein C2orf42 n=1 Tax=Phlebotomus argentipes TaxID=94469 RepID=UPI0028935F07|nr:uncharacterized protein C2orf42 [Phlebotomus argentipes]
MKMDLKDVRGNMRGLKKCPSCFKYNGLRAKGCRNRDCALNLKNKTQSSTMLDAVALLGQGDSRLFSVKTREKCSESVDTRSFVKITDKVVESDATASIIHRNAICFVDTCKYDSKDHDVTCKHVKEASETAVEAIGLSIKRETFYSITVISDAEKHSQWQEVVACAASPAVQRINKKIFVVRCEGTATGYVHCELSRDDAGAPMYSCSCKVIKILLDLNTIVMEKEVCRHMMLLSAALNSDSRLQNLYKQHLDLWKHIYSTFDRAIYQIPSASMDTDIADLSTEIEFISDPTRDEFCTGDSGGNWQNSLDNFVINNMELQDCQIELMDDFQLTDQLDLCADDLIDPLNAPTSTGLLDTIVPPNDQIHFQTIELRMKNPEPSQVRESQAKRRMRKIFQRAKLTYDVQEMDRHVAFEQWLASVVERINFSPDYNDVSHLVRLTFSAHSNFFNCLHMRFSKDASKRKLPNKCEVINSGPHAGLVTNVFHFSSKSEIVRIFSNETVKFEIERYFKLSSNKYVPMSEQDLRQHLEVNHNGNDGKWCPVKPTEYKTFIRMSSSHCFTIKWTADTLPRSNHGEMVIEFAVGRMKNGQQIP